MRMQTAVVTKVACRNAYECLVANSLAFIASRCSPQARRSPRARGADQLARVGARPSTPVARPALLRPAQKHPTSGSPETVEPTARPACPGPISAPLAGSRDRTLWRTPAASTTLSAARAQSRAPSSGGSKRSPRDAAGLAPARGEADSGAALPTKLTIRR